MKHYYISGTHGETHDRNIALWKTLWETGERIKHEYNGDHFVITVKHDGKLYELWYNDDLGIISEVVEL